MNSDIKIIAFDIDGTLIPWKKKTVERSSVEAINKAKENGYKIIVSTGRIINFIQPSIFKEINPDYYICVNGQIIYDKDLNVIARYNITEEDITKLLNECRSLKIPLAFKWENKMVVYNLFEEFKRNYLVGENHDDDLIDATDKCDYHKTNGLPLSSFMCADERYVSYMQKLFDTMVFVKPKENAIEGYNIKHSKATGIEEVAKKDGYGLNNVMCFGDADNDIAMLIKAKIGVAMGNASEKAKASADFVTNDCDKDGIELALKKYNII